MTVRIPNIAIVILAAGASSRMGSPKQLLNWGNTSLIQHTLNIAKTTKAVKTFVVLGADSEKIKEEIKEAKVSIILNPEWELGLGKSIARAASVIFNSKENFDGILVALADQPFVTPSFLNQMIDEFSLNKNGIIATFYNTKKNGVPVLFAKSYLSELNKLDDDFGAKLILEKHESKVKSLVPNFENLDIDTKEDYKSLDNKEH
ncbi:nucleotidyltransferase family protein [Algibacter sp. 2305UL17-15]|uniref:nucleotidyltransferase family protein n=1 Tax=Algibacter sp. 2305UL17-15 TaxID=3231268 RepID=UPI00345ADACA